ncbi:MAG: cellulase family glycosylhydrolase, partial [Acidimicrobiales bacterium]
LATWWSVNRGCGGQSSDAGLDAFFASLDRGSVVRFWAYQDFAVDKTTGALNWYPIDRVVAAAERNGQRLLPVLGDQWAHCNGEQYKDAAFYAGGYRSTVAPGLRMTYHDWALAVVNRYGGSPAIAMWELLNEPEAPCSGGAALLRAFFDDMGARLRATGDRHLISSGTLGGQQCGLARSDYATVHASAGIDVASYHDYGNETVALPADLATRLSQAAGLGKPLIVGEVGIVAGAGCSLSLSARRDLMAAKQAAQTAAGVAGFLPWRWSETASGCSHDFTGADPLMGLL